MIYFRYEECTKLCDQGLKIDAKDAKFLDFRSRATKALKEAERNARREAALSKKLENEKQRLIQAIKDRGIKLKR